MKKNYKSIVCIIVFACFNAQNVNAQKSDKNSAYSLNYHDSIIDTRYGITIYEQYNPLEDNKKRACGESLCFGKVEDYYLNDSILHKGYYVAGVLQSYTNYYPNGVIERDAKYVSGTSSKVILNYPSGVVKSQILYINGEPYSWMDYYSNGEIEFEELYNKTYTKLLKRISYRNDGSVSDEQILINKSKSIYSYKEYYENGKIKIDGEKLYSKENDAFTKSSKWIEYNEDGSEK